TMFGTANQPILKNQSQGFLATLYNPEKPLSVKISNSNLSVWHLLKDSTDDSRDSWQKKASIGSSFPDEVYYFHPIAFVQHLRRLIPQSLRFPLASRPAKIGTTESYKAGMRSFGSGRSKVNGQYTRYHAGCDLYANMGDEIYAVADGKIIGYYRFYLKTSALVVDHNDFLAVYGEVQPPATNDHYVYESQFSNERKGLPGNLSVGSDVRRGQHIAYVGQMRYNNNNKITIQGVEVKMLHLEMYSDTSTSIPTSITAGYPLTDLENTSNYDNVTAKAYKRRKDLLDPTSKLDEMVID
ncbi:MAG: M23 family metallopeptidase, partial [Proteobacteria bacterium]|nr:M23 family metallopeptidase [Pseudomonadota bacterium]